MPAPFVPLDMRTTRRAVLGGVLGLGALSVLSGCGRGQAEAAPKFDLSKPVKGGSLTVGFVGGGASDTLDAQVATNLGDIGRAINLYNSLMYFDDDYELRPMLAEEITPNEDATVWTVKLRSGVKFSDGRPLRPEDVIASYTRIIDPDDPKNGAASLGHLDRMVKVDERTVEFHLSSADAEFDNLTGSYSNVIVPEDFDVENPVGTGPFMLEDFVPAQSTVMVPNPHYWGDEGPHLERVVLLNFNDNDALINALLSNQVDAIASIPAALTHVLESDPRLSILNSVTGMYLPFTMRVDQEPFDDVRVRQAMRLAVDRPGMINQTLSGQGIVGNDMYAVFDPSYPDVPQREQNIAEAKRLLAEAGHPDGIDIELVTAPIQAGAVEAAQVFAQQAKEADIRVKINQMDLTAFWGDYLNYGFSQSFWYTRNFLEQASASSLPDSPFNECHFDDPEFNELVAAARAERDPERRAEIIAEAQTILFERGGFIIWGFANQLDAHQNYVGGLVENRTGIPLSGFQFHRVFIGEAL
ncbi:ABC transporter substrate-binding protein [Propioniferax innocua]|uniref:Peptide/nickel transport system substrate-binding protein n=1 Tax=Propioniferax innocua TaxID=1753 RepID=A0A542ZSG5_9ACTN|nr:ABC transporter substrate-binding protein [Propioniferax innocua]TQL63180.1 peptide/nickel transport system substrate-binding protein [Propioniferax innocua]